MTLSLNTVHRTIARLRQTIPAFLLFIAATLPLSAVAKNIGLVGLFPGKALISIDGGPPKTIALGATLHSTIKLISIQNNQATFEVDGNKQTLQVGQNVIVGPLEKKTSVSGVTLSADSRGHFSTQGQINGVNVAFLVDTGASFVSMGLGEANRLGLNLANGERVYTGTANGIAPAVKIKLDSVSLKDIVLYNVDAIVVPQDMPAILLGMSFLKRMEINSNAHTMTIKKMY